MAAAGRKSALCLDQFGVTIQAIITEPNFFPNGNAYFRAIWEQAQKAHGATQLAILRQLVDRPLLLTVLQPVEGLEAAIALPLEHDIIQATDHGYTYRVELMHQWVALATTRPSPNPPLPGAYRDESPGHP